MSAPVGSPRTDLQATGCLAQCVLARACVSRNRSACDLALHFWTCPVSRPLQGRMWAAIMAAAPQGEGPASGALSKRQVWLAEPPPTVHRAVWYVVCLAAIYAMEQGRRYLYRNRAEAPTQAFRQCASAVVIGEFVGRLKSFAGLGLKQKGWSGVRADHPFLTVDDEGKPCFVGLPGMT